MTTNLLKTTGTVNFLKHNDNHSIVGLVIDGSSQTFYAFDDVKRQIQSTVSLSNELCIDYVLSKSRSRQGDTFNKIKSFVNQTPEILEGTLTNLNNVRAVKNDASDVYVCLKQSTGKVVYVHMSKQLTESAWFKKGNKVRMEGYFEYFQDAHKVYKVKSLFIA